MIHAKPETLAIFYGYLLYAAIAMIMCAYVAGRLIRPSWDNGWQFVGFALTCWIAGALWPMVILGTFLLMFIEWVRT